MGTQLSWKSQEMKRNADTQSKYMPEKINRFSQSFVENFLLYGPIKQTHREVCEDFTNSLHSFTPVWTEGHGQILSRFSVTVESKINNYGGVFDFH